MLTISRVACGGAAYYLAKDNYHFRGETETCWMGKVAEILGLKGRVQRQDFESVLAGWFPGGINLTRYVDGKNSHRPGYDLTLSAPKSVSVLSLVFGDSRMCEAHQHAVSITVSEIERLAGIRKMRNGVSQKILTGQLLVAAIQHDTSRELDPHLHTHLIVMNITEYNGQWKALSSDKVRKNGFIENVYALQLALGKIYRNALRQQVQEMGFRTVNTGKNDLWEIDGVPVDIFSQRARQIQDAVGEGASLKSRDVAALDTRKRKLYAPDKRGLLTDWMNRLEQSGFNYSRFCLQAELRRQRYDCNMSCYTAQTLDDVRQAVKQAISLLSETRVRFTYSDVLNGTLNALDARHNIVRLARQAIEEAITTQQLVPLDREKGLFTSSLHLLDELSVQHLARQIQTTVTVPVCGRARTDNPIMAQLASDSPAIAIVSHAPGAKAMRETIASVVTLSRTLGREYFVLATDRRSVSWLNTQAAPVSHVFPLQERLTSPLPKNCSLIVAGAEKLSVRDMLVVTDQALRANSQLLLIDGGGRSGTGNALQTLEDAGISRYRLTTGRPVEVCVVSLPDKQQRYRTLAKDYASLVEKGKDAVVQTSGTRERYWLTATIRQVFQEQGLISRQAITVNTLEPQWFDSKRRKQLDTYREGMVLEQHLAKHTKPVRYNIEQVRAQTHSLLLKDTKGAPREVALRELDNSWCLYRSQKAEIAEGEKLTWLARQGKLRAGDSVTVKKIIKGRLVVAHKYRGLLVVPLSDGLKAGYGYVTTPGAHVSEQGTVLAAVTVRDTSATQLNTLARSGNRVQLYTPLAKAEAEHRLSRSLLYRTALMQIDPDNHGLANALDKARDNILGTEEKAVRQAISMTQGSEVFFSRLAVLANALTVHPRLTTEAVIRELARQERTGEIIPVPGEKGTGQQLYVTSVAYETEKHIIRLVAEGLETLPPLLANPNPALFRGLTAGQQQAARLILENTDRFVAIQGYAGVGKTTQLRAVMRALMTLPAEQRPQVVGLAPTHRAVGELVDVGIKAQTLASFLMEMERRTQAGEKAFFRNTLFLLDESSMVGNQDLAEVMKYITAGGGRAVMCGDRDQLLPVASGAPFTLLQERSPLDRVIMKDIVRQSPALRPAIYAMIARKVPAALDSIRRVTPDVVPREEGSWSPRQSVMAVRQTPQRSKAADDRLIRAIVDDFCGRTATARAATLIVTQTNQDKNTINRAIHTRLQERGVLTEEITIPVLERVKTHAARLKSISGMAEHNGQIALINDRYYTIRAGAESFRHGYVELIDEAGGVKVLSPFESSLRDIAVFAPGTINVSVGESVRFSRSDRDRGRDANSCWTVSAISKAGELYLTRGAETRILNPGLEPADRHLDYGYAGTAHKAQGASAQYVIVLAGVEGGRKALATMRDAYVAFSRAKKHVQVYTDNLPGWLSKVTQPSERQTVHDMLLPEDDLNVTVVQALWEKARPVAKTPFRDDLLNRIPESRAARFIQGNRRSVAPCIALPAYDKAGKLCALILKDIALDRAGQLSGLSDTWRWLGSGAAGQIVVSHSESGQTRIAETLTDARRLAQDYPRDGIVILTDDAPVTRVIHRLTGGTLLMTLPPDWRRQGKEKRPEPYSLKTPAEQRAEKALMQHILRKQQTGKSYPVSSLADTFSVAEKQVIHELLQERNQARRHIREVIRAPEKGERHKQPAFPEQRAREMAKEMGE